MGSGIQQMIISEYRIYKNHDQVREVRFRKNEIDNKRGIHMSVGHFVSSHLNRKRILCHQIAVVVVRAVTKSSS